MSLQLLHVVLWIALGLALLGTVSSTVFLVLAALGGFHFRRHRNDLGSFAPPVSILKPVHGAEDGMEANFRSFFELDYPAYELIFCARSLDDPAIRSAQALAAQNPHVPARFMASGEPLWTNPKIFSMSLLEGAAQHEFVLFSDSDVRVTPDYLQRVIQPMADPQTGLVTCLFRGSPGPGFWSVLTALNQSVEFSSGALTANLLEGAKFGLGPTLLTTKQNLRDIGGLEPMAELLADDFWLGHKTFEAGKKVYLSSHVVDHHVFYRSFRSSFRHQFGWMKNTRRTRPAGHFGVGLTYAVPYGVLGFVSAAALGHARLGLALLLASLVNRWLQAIFAGLSIRDRGALRRFWLNPLSDAIGFAAWFLSLFGDEIDYRGDRYRLLAGGYLLKKS